MNRNNKIIRVLFLVFLIIQILLTSILPVAFSQQTAGSWKYEIEHTESVYPNNPIAISADGNYIIACLPNKLYFFERSQSTPLWIYEADDYINSVAISSNGSFAVAATWNTIYCFNTSKTTPFWIYNFSFGSINSVSITSSGSRVIASNADGIVFLFNNTNLGYKYDESTFKPLFNYTINLLDSPSGRVTSTDISADGKYCVVGDSSGRVYLLNGANLSLVWENLAITDINVVAISADGNHIAAGAASIVYFLEATNSTPKWVALTSGKVAELAVSADGEYIVAGGRQNDLYLFNKSSSTPEWVYALADVNSVAISSNGTYIAAGVNTSPVGKTVLLLFKNSSTPILNLGLPSTNYESSITGIDISSDGRYIVVTKIFDIYMVDRTFPIIRGKKEIDFHVIPGFIASIGAILLLIIRIRRNSTNAM